ncbi:hypothetical protein Pint_16881 [Pistacia integerrima]|uniref:Uncharacterized protein n=1 Tax=Pistacia integerrima TaxID=434235 RepID=A0ACC0ZD09_9ROSI|nr:hypothetical protein Pint_16881 [Pistacia integerrima]
MESRGLPSGSSLEKKLKRREILEKKKAIDQLIKAAYAQNDHLDSFPPFRHFQRNGVCVHLESGRGDKLSSSEKHYIQNLLKVISPSLNLFICSFLRVPVQLYVL